MADLDQPRPGVFPGRLTRWGILNIRLLFKSHALLFSLLFTGDFVGDKALMEGTKS